MWLRLPEGLFMSFYMGFQDNVHNYLRYYFHYIYLTHEKSNNQKKKPDVGYQLFFLYHVTNDSIVIFKLGLSYSRSHGPKFDHKVQVHKKSG